MSLTPEVINIKADAGTREGTARSESPVTCKNASCTVLQLAVQAFVKSGYREDLEAQVAAPISYL